MKMPSEVWITKVSEGCCKWWPAPPMDQLSLHLIEIFNGRDAAILFNNEEDGKEYRQYFTYKNRDDLDNPILRGMLE